MSNFTWIWFNRNQHSQYCSLTRIWWWNDDLSEKGTHSSRATKSRRHYDLPNPAEWDNLHAPSCIPLHSQIQHNTMYQYLDLNARTSIWNFMGGCKETPICRHVLGMRHFVLQVANLHVSHLFIYSASTLGNLNEKIKTDAFINPKGNFGLLRLQSRTRRKSKTSQYLLV